MTVYHLELRQFPHTARVFNLDREGLDTRFLKPLVAGEAIDYEDRRWLPEKTRLTVLEGVEVPLAERGMGRGWGVATQHGRDVTEQVVAEIHRGADARPEVELLKDAVAEVAGGGQGIAFGDAVALAVVRQPQWRASEQLALAEQAIWELLHQGRLQLEQAGVPVARERWQEIVLQWSTWTGDSGAGLRLRAP